MLLLIKNNDKLWIAVLLGAKEEFTEQMQLVGDFKAEGTVDVRQLKFFLEIARHGSFTRAANELHIAQPALSMSMKKLEEELEVVLLNRQDRKISLTAEGEALHSHAVKIVDDLEKAFQEMADIRGLMKGEVRVGLTPMLSTYFFPKIISAFKKRYPQLQLSVYGDSAWRIQRMILDGDLDIGVIAGPTVPEALEVHHLLHEEIVACVPTNHRFAGRKSVPTEEILREPLVLFKEGYYLRELIANLIEQHGIKADVAFESNLFSLIKNIVKEGMGVAFFLKMVTANDPGLVTIKCDPPLYLDLFIGWKKKAYLSRANRAFVDFLVEETDEFYRMSETTGPTSLP